MINIIGKHTRIPAVEMQPNINAARLLDVRSHAIHCLLNYLRLSSCVILGGLPGIMVRALVYTSNLIHASLQFIF